MSFSTSPHANKGRSAACACMDARTLPVCGFPACARSTSMLLLGNGPSSAAAMAGAANAPLANDTRNSLRFIAIILPQESCAVADMFLVDISAIALQGLETSQAQFDHAAGRLASVGSPAADTVDLSAETVAI